MLNQKKVKISSILLIMCISLSLSIFIINNNLNYNIDDDKLNQNLSEIKVSVESKAYNTIIGNIENRSGKIFSNITIKTKNCSVNRYNTSINKQPKIYLETWNLTYSQMKFENITASNYTRVLNINPIDYNISSTEDPLYLYQKFSVELSQNVNNVTIFIQDICNPFDWSESTKWEVAILNCSNDMYGTPSAILDVLKKPHPISIAAHFNVFDFKNSGNGPVFLDVSKTNYTVDGDGINKYWFAFRIKVPPNDEAFGGGPKFVYHNNDNITSKIGFGLDSLTLKPSDIKMQLKINNNNYNINDLGYQCGIWSSNISNGTPVGGYYQFNVSSIWRSICFDVIGNYSIERSHEFNWSYILSNFMGEISWNVSISIDNFGETLGSIIDHSKSFQFFVPKDWSLIKIYNNSDSPPIADGGWNWSINIIDLQKIITVDNISVGFWNVQMNSTKSSIDITYNSTTLVNIDKIIQVNATIENCYGGDLFFKVYNESSALLYNDYYQLNESKLENSTSFLWDISSTTNLSGTYFLSIYWIKYNQTHAFLSLGIIEVNVIEVNVIKSTLIVENDSDDDDDVDQGIDTEIIIALVTLLLSVSLIVPVGIVIYLKKIKKSHLMFFELEMNGTCQL